MRLLALLSDGFGAGGGIARYNQALMTALSHSAGVSEIAVLSRFAAAAVATPIKVCQLAPSAGRTSWSARALALAARQRFDAVFCGHFNAVPLAAAISRALSAPLWVQVHGIEAWQPRSSLYRRCVAAAALITAVSRYTRSRLLAWADVAPHRVRVLPNTVASGYVPRRRRDDLVARHGLAGRRVILTVGRLSASERYKGHDRLIAALPGILAKVQDAAYLIVGSGEDRPRLEKLAREVAIADRVVFAGQVPDVDLPDYFALADIFAMPSTGEGFGIVFLEAAASGLAVVGGNCDGSVDAMAEGRIGRLVDPHSREGIEAAVVDAFQGRHPASVAEVERFSFQHFASHVDELVRSLAR
jgi:phosphatidylinositol alpha-1,6-mannosyltransferase